MLHRLPRPVQRCIIDADQEKKGDFVAKNKQQKTPKQKRASILGFALTAAGLVLLSGSALTFLGVVAIAAASFGVGKLVGTMSGGLDLTTHNRQDHPRQFEDLAPVGNEEADNVITQGQEALKQIRAANDAISDPELTRKMYLLEEKCFQMFKTVSEKPDQAFQIRKFMNYYLPTTLKMLKSYQVMQERGISASELAKHRQSLNRGLDMVNTACQKQLDNLFRDTMLDVSTDIDVLEQMLRRDGFTESDLSAAGISQLQEEARTAAAAQLAGREIPSLQLPDSHTPGYYAGMAQTRQKSQQ